MGGIYKSAAAARYIDGGIALYNLMPRRIVALFMRFGVGAWGSIVGIDDIVGACIG